MSRDSLLHTPSTLRGLAEYFKDVARKLNAEAVVMEECQLDEVLVGNKSSINIAKGNSHNYTIAIQKAIKTAREARGDFGPDTTPDTESDTTTPKANSKHTKKRSNRTPNGGPKSA